LRKRVQSGGGVGQKPHRVPLSGSQRSQTAPPKGNKHRKRRKRGTAQNEAGDVKGAKGTKEKSLAKACNLNDQAKEGSPTNKIWGRKEGAGDKVKGQGRRSKRREGWFAGNDGWRA